MIEEFFVNEINQEYMINDSGRLKNFYEQVKYLFVEFWIDYIQSEISITFKTIKNKRVNLNLIS